MDIKEAAQQVEAQAAIIKEKVDKALAEALEARRELAEFDDLYQLPSESQCVKDIDEFWKGILRFVSSRISLLNDPSSKTLEHKQIKDGLDQCSNALFLAEDFKNKSLNIELCRHIRINTLPPSYKNNDEFKKS